MTAALAGLAAALAVLAATEGLRAVDTGRVLAVLGSALAPARAAGRAGRAREEERRRLALVAGLSAAAAGWLVAGPAAALLLGVGGPPLAVVVVRARRARWRARVEAHAPATARALADAYAAGHALPGALDLVVADAALPSVARDLLRESTAAISCGASPAEALRRLAGRTGPGAWTGICALVLLQRESGGDVVRMLREFAADIEHGAQAEAEARTASAQARLTARIVVGLPAVGSAIALVLRPGLAGAIAQQPGPRVLVLAALVLQVAALGAIRLLARPREC
ncbi:unannotated protein [freshwater metagenome]|uniref:Unannotated protein n=1 Tax=freshwater metagenome TaxID=449393 RepID=A0A6J7DNZ1_9ZZZZ|nr:hypothetical protein [Actinomycetota bacterium]